MQQKVLNQIRPGGVVLKGAGLCLQLGVESGTIVPEPSEKKERSQRDLLTYCPDVIDGAAVVMLQSGN